MSSSQTPATPPRPSRAHAIEQATGQDWQDWISWLESADAASLEHQPMAELILAQLEAGGFQQLENKPWWAQTIAISYEQQIGRRIPGQRSDGSFEATASKTVALDRADAWDVITNNVANRTSLFGAQLADSRTSTTLKRDYWRATLVPERKIQIALESKPGGKTLVTGTSYGLVTDAERQEHKREWKELFGQLFS
ncbi:hypothetical protein [Micrococcoides hystricis]|uniref:DUF4287 domain-containing protein n=1 Tax=Micrococcoides hystricis TaxID=1572761 RepID=A0ABV6P7V2_9MICC